MIAEWTVPFLLTTPQGTIQLSGSTGYKFDQSGCDAGADLRVTVNDIPQADGSILGRVFAEGYRMRLAIQLWEADDQPACDTILREMADALALHLWALRDPDSGGRIQWEPSGADTRMLDQIKIIEREQITFESGSICTVTFALATRYPYAMDLTETTTTITSGNGDVITNSGTAEFWPVFKVYGPTSSFTLENTTQDLRIIYDASLPGGFGISGGSYVEIDTFRNTAYIDGNMANAKPNIDMERSDFWSLTPGVNTINMTGADVDILWNNAWE